MNNSSVGFVYDNGNEVIMVINEFENQSDHPCDNDKSRFGNYLTKNKLHTTRGPAQDRE